MSNDLYAPVEFTSITPLIDVQPTPSNDAAGTSQRFTLEWSFVGQNPITNFTKIEIYRYIGNHNECVPYVTEDFVGSKLIYKAVQTNADVVISEYNPSPIFTQTSTRSNTNIKDVVQYTDNLGLWYSPGSTSMGAFHSRTDFDNDQQFLQQIYTSERTIYYIIKTFTQGALDAVPYCIGTHRSSRYVDNTSTKTQVRHNILHYEGDYIWETDCSRVLPESTNSLSRTTVDINRVFLDKLQRGPTGRGGYAWASSRDSAQGTNVLRFQLSNGLNSGVWTVPGHTINGGAIACRISDGACYAAGGTNNRDGDVADNCEARVARIDAPGYYDEWARNPTSPVIINSNWCHPGGYGATNFFGSNTSAYMHERRSLYRVNSNGVVGTSVTTGGNMYGLGAAPDGRILFGYAYGGSNTITIYNPSNNSSGTFASNAPGATTSLTCSYPRDPSQSVNSDWTAYYSNDSGDGPGGLAAKRNSDGVTTTFFTGTDKIRGCGVDGENNIWGFGLKRVKAYHTIAGGGNGINDNSFPLGLNARYLALRLDKWRTTATNTRHVEWFLTRNHFNMDNTISLLWIDPLNDTREYYTAREAWDSLVEWRRKEDGSGGWTVWKSPTNANTYTTDTKLYGAKFKHLIDIETLSEEEQSQKEIEAFFLINLWATLYADDRSDVCYPDQDSTTRDALVAQNLQGRVIHPGHVFRTDQTTAGQYVIDEVPRTSTKVKVNHTFLSKGGSNENAHYVIFENVNRYSYQYSDFTGNLLSNAISESPYSQNVIHPPIILPTLSINLSGYQSNPGYKDPENIKHCYPWENIVRDSQEICVNRNRLEKTSFDIQTGDLCLNGPTLSTYDDTNALWTLDADPGTFVIRNWTLSTHDFNNIVYSSPDNITFKPNIIEYSTSFNFNHIYKDPSLLGRYYLPDGEPLIENSTQYLDNDKRRDGYFSSVARISAINLYNCRTKYEFAFANVYTLERWPEPRFFINITDSSTLRCSFFNNTYEGTTIQLLDCPNGSSGNITITTPVTVVGGVTTNYGTSITSYNCNYDNSFNAISAELLNNYSPPENFAKIIINPGDIINLESPWATLGEYDLEVRTAALNQSLVWLPNNTNSSSGYARVYKNIMTDGSNGITVAGAYKTGEQFTLTPDDLKTPIVLPTKDFAPGYSASTPIRWPDYQTQTFTDTTVGAIFGGDIPGNTTRQLSAFEFCLNTVNANESPSRCVILPDLATAPYSVWFAGRNHNAATFIDASVKNTTLTPTSTGTTDIREFGVDAAVKYQVFLKENNRSVIAAYPHLQDAYDLHAENYFAVADNRPGSRAIAADKNNDVWFNTQYSGEIIKIPNAVYSDFTNISNAGQNGKLLSSYPNYKRLTATNPDHPYTFYGIETDNFNNLYCICNFWVRYKGNNSNYELHWINTDTNKRVIIDLSYNGIGRATDTTATSLTAYNINTQAYTPISDIFLGSQSVSLCANEPSQVLYYSTSFNPIPYGISKGTYNNREYVIVSGYTGGAVAQTGWTILLDTEKVSNILSSSSGSDPIIVSLSTIQNTDADAVKVIVADLFAQYDLLVNSSDPLDYRNAAGTPRQSLIFDGYLYGSGETGQTHRYSLVDAFSPTSKTLITDKGVKLQSLTPELMNTRALSVKTGIAAIRDENKNPYIVVLSQSNGKIAYIDPNTKNVDIKDNSWAGVNHNYNYTNFTGFSESYEQEDNGSLSFTVSANTTSPVKWKSVDVTLAPSVSGSSSNTSMPMSANLYLVSGTNQTLKDTRYIYQPTTLKAQFFPEITATHVNIKVEMYRDTLNINARTPPESLKVDSIRVDYNL